MGKDGQSVPPLTAGASKDDVIWANDGGFCGPGNGLLRQGLKRVMLKTTFLRSRVARRIFALFVACALVPMAVFTTLSFVEVSHQLRSQNQRQLQQAAKSLGLAIYERLTILDADLQVASLRIQHGDPVPSPTGEPHFQTVTVWKDQGSLGSRPHSGHDCARENAIAFRRIAGSRGLLLYEGVREMRFDAEDD